MLRNVIGIPLLQIQKKSNISIKAIDETSASSNVQAGIFLVVKKVLARENTLTTFKANQTFKFS